MKHIITKVFLLLLLAVAGMAKAQSFQPYKSGVIPYHGYAYSVVPGTETWKQINIDIFAFDDQLGSFGRVKHQFNGYAELYQRTDFVQQLISFYNSRNVSYVDQIALDYDRGLYAFDYTIMEFMFTDAVPLASNAQSAQIATLLLDKTDQKAQNRVYGSTNRITLGLAIGRCLQRTNTFADYQGSTLQGFLQSGKLANPSDLDYIFNKARTL